MLTMDKPSIIMDKPTIHNSQGIKMKIQSYYSAPLPKIHNGDFEINDEPLIVNCTGFWRRDPNPEPIITDRPQGRKDFYLLYMTDGTMDIRLPDGETQFSRGCFVIYPPHTPYYHSYISDKPMSYLWVHFTGFHARRLLSSLGIEPQRVYKTDGSDRKINLLGDTFEKLFSEFTNLRPGFEAKRASILTDILVTLTREADKVSSGKARKLESVAYLHQHFKEETPITDLAEMEHLCESRYREIFKNHTGFSPGDYRTMLRIQHACELLEGTDFTMAKIALECGYTDVYYFLRIFKLKKGVTPGEYRTKSRGAQGN